MWLLGASQPAAAVMRQGDVGAKGTRPAGGAATAPAVPTANREGFVQALDAVAHTIVINSTRYLIGAPQLLLLDKRPKSDGLLTLAGLKVGMFVRYRVQSADGAQRVVELWVIRDPQQILGTKP
jgi:hypothetical protein